MPILDLDDRSTDVPANVGPGGENYVALRFNGDPVISNDGQSEIVDGPGNGEIARYANVASVDGNSVDLVGVVIRSEQIDNAGNPNGTQVNSELNNVDLDGDGSANLSFSASSTVTVRWAVVESGTDTPVFGDFAALFTDLDGVGNLSRYERIIVDRDQIDSYTLENDANNPTSVQVSENGNTLIFQPNDRDPGTPGNIPDNAIALTFANTSEFTITYERLNIGGNIGLDGTFENNFFADPIVIDTNSSFQTVYTEGQGPVALVDQETVLVDTEGANVQSLSIGFSPSQITDAGQETLNFVDDFGDPVTLILGGTDTTIYPITVGGADFTIQLGANQIEINAVGGGAPDTALANLLGQTFYSNGANKPAGVDPTAREFEFILTDANGDSSGPAVSSVTLVGVADVLPCFTRGTRIETKDRTMPIEELQIGDLIATADHGLQAIRWIGQSRCLAAKESAPIRISRGALGNARSLLVSPQHRFVLKDWRAQLWFGLPEVLVSAKTLINGTTIRPEPGGIVEYYHILFDRHEIIYAEGIETESFHPGDYIIGAMGEATREEIYELFPELRKHGARSYGGLARPVLRQYEMQALAV